MAENGKQFIKCWRGASADLGSITPAQGEPAVALDVAPPRFHIGDGAMVSGHRVGHSVPRASEVSLAADDPIVAGLNTTTLQVTLASNTDHTTTRFWMWGHLTVRYTHNDAPPRASNGRFTPSLFNVTTGATIALSAASYITAEDKELQATWVKSFGFSSTHALTEGDVIRLDVTQSATPDMTATLVASHSGTLGLCRLGYVEGIQ